MYKLHDCEYCKTERKETVKLDYDGKCPVCNRKYPDLAGERAIDLYDSQRLSRHYHSISHDSHGDRPKPGDLIEHPYKHMEGRKCQVLAVQASKRARLRYDNERTRMETKVWLGEYHGYCNVIDAPESPTKKRPAFRRQPNALMFASAALRAGYRMKRS